MEMVWFGFPEKITDPCQKSLTNSITSCCIEYTSPWTGFELTMLEVIDTDCTGSCKSNYHTIMTTTTLDLQVFTVMLKIRHVRQAVIENTNIEIHLWNVIKWIRDVPVVVGESLYTKKNKKNANMFFVVYINWIISPPVDISVHSDILPWSWVNKSVIIP